MVYYGLNRPDLTLATEGGMVFWWYGVLVSVKGGKLARKSARKQTVPGTLERTSLTLPAEIMSLARRRAYEDSQRTSRTVTVAEILRKAIERGLRST